MEDGRVSLVVVIKLGSRGGAAKRARYATSCRSLAAPATGGGGRAVAGEARKRAAGPLAVHAHPSRAAMQPGPRSGASCHAGRPGGPSLTTARSQTTTAHLPTRSHHSPAAPWLRRGAPWSAPPVQGLSSLGPAVGLQAVWLCLGVGSAATRKALYFFGVLSLLRPHVPSSGPPGPHQFFL